MAIDMEDGTQTEILDLDALHEKVSTSEYGEILSQQTRFDRFRPEHLSKDQWCELLGQDVSGLGHMSELHALAQDFLSYPSDQNLFTEDEKRIILLAAITNNWGEAVTGNVIYDEKTTDGTRAEQEAFRRVFAEIYGDNSKTETLVESTIFGSEGKLAEAFNAIERLGYLRTALLAYSVSKGVDDPLLATHLRWLCADVLSHQTLRLLEFAQQFKYINRFLTDNGELINEAFSDIPPEVFAQHGQSETRRREFYLNSRNAWERRVTSEISELEAAVNERLSLITDEDAKKEIIGLISQLKELQATPGRRMQEETFDRGIFGGGSNLEARFYPDWSRLERTIGALREIGMRIVLTSGGFDIIHRGHMAYLEKAAAQGDVLVVGVDSDEKLRTLKGEGRPVVPEHERVAALAHLRGVGIITIKQLSEERWQLIRLVRPDTLIVTEEHYRRYTPEDINELRQHVGRIVALPPQAETSTTARIRRLHIDFAGKLEEGVKELIRKLIENA